MHSALLLCALLAAAATPAPIKVAAPGLKGANVSKETTSFLGDHLAQRLMLEGLEVTTAEQIQSVLGLERQKQLLGCSGESNCMAELANALGADALLVGRSARSASATRSTSLW